MPLFRSSPKSPQELVKNLEEALKVLNVADGGGKKAEKVCGRVCLCVCDAGINTVGWADGINI